ncbi:hypothetical protein Bca52824_060535 [Brassica carinata]|uniref:Uncharacterized protein n=1 Tax=Brassica carinata TaxID=52824 RepID=A0A8X7UFP8_BRACI|nr:hypothetical protein Bca52824_060535 [Brassica carinata]
MAFAQMAPNFFHYFLSSWVRAREEGLEFGLGELKQLFAIKQNSGFPGTMILAPRPGRFIIDGIPNRDHRWREKFFVFKINPASVEPFGPAPMTPELRGLITTLLRGNPRWLAYTVDRIQAANALPPGENHATPIGLAAPVRPGKGRRNKTREKEPLPDHPTSPMKSGRWNELRKLGADRFLNRGRRLSLLALWLGRLGLPPPLRASGEGTSQNPEHLALIWHKIREKGCELPSFGDMREHDAYVRMAVANDKAMDASNEYAALMERRLADFPSKKEAGSHLLTIQKLRGELEAVQVTEQQREVDIEGLKGKLAAAETEKVAVQNDLDLMKEKHRREIEGCDATGRKECNLARLSLAREYDAVLAVVKDKLQKKKKKTAAEIRLQEEISLDVDYGLASGSDSSLSRLEHPEVSGDSIDQD